MLPLPELLAHPRVRVYFVARTHSLSSSPSPWGLPLFPPSSQPPLCMRLFARMPHNVGQTEAGVSRHMQRQINRIDQVFCPVCAHLYVFCDCAHVFVFAREIEGCVHASVRLRASGVGVRNCYRQQSWLHVYVSVFMRAYVCVLLQSFFPPNPPYHTTTSPLLLKPMKTGLSRRQHQGILPRHLTHELTRRHGPLSTRQRLKSLPRAPPYANARRHARAFSNT